MISETINTGVLQEAFKNLYLDEKEATGGGGEAVSWETWEFEICEWPFGFWAGFYCEMWVAIWTHLGGHLNYATVDCND